MVSAQTVAYYVINFFHEREDLITNLKLQKLLYYVQGWHLGLYEKELFQEDFQAWIHGPVQCNIYNEYKHYRWNPISETTPPFEVYTNVESHINEVLYTYGIETAYALERMTHREDPWLLARDNLPHDAESTNIISKESMQTYFSRLANEENS